VESKTTKQKFDQKIGELESRLKKLRAIRDALDDPDLADLFDTPSSESVLEQLRQRCDSRERYDLPVTVGDQGLQVGGETNKTDVNARNMGCQMGQECVAVCVS
jgi:hypothetical protein